MSILLPFYFRFLRPASASSTAAGCGIRKTYCSNVTPLGRLPCQAGPPTHRVSLHLRRLIDLRLVHNTSSEGNSPVADAEKRAKLTAHTRAELVDRLERRYESGASIRQLAEETKRSYGFIHRALTEAGVRLRGRAVRRAEDDARKTAHQLVDALPRELVPDATALLQRLVHTGQPPPQRRFRTVGVFDGEPDLGRRAKEIARRELGRTSDKTADHYRHWPRGRDGQPQGH